MKRSGQMKAIALGAALALALATGQLAAEKTNPYLTIAERNAFALGDPPKAPEAPPPKPEPPKPVSTVRLTGITTILAKARALFEIVEAPGKPMDKPIMLVGDKVGDIELLSINVDKNMVTIRQSGVETNLVLEARKAPPAPGPGQRPGMAPGLRPGFPPPGIKLPSQQTAALTPGGASPTVITPGSSGTSSGRSGVITVGGTASTAAATPAAAPGTAATPPGWTGTGRAMPYRIAPGAGTTAGTAPAFNAPVPNAASLRMAPTRELPQRPTRTQSMGPAALEAQADSVAANQVIMDNLRHVVDPSGPPPLPMEE